MDAKQEVSIWIRDKIESSISKINRCLFPEPRLNGTQDGFELWLLFESVPANGYLPAFQQKHEIKFAASTTCTCRCPYFLSTKLPCNAICALLGKKGYVTMTQLSQFLHDMWLVKNHPLYDVAIKPADQLATHSTALTTQPPSETAQRDHIRRLNADAMRSIEIPSDATGRRHYFSLLWDQILPGTILSAQSSRALAEFMVRHRADLGQAHALIVPPARAISSIQERSGMGPAYEVANLANKAPYDRSAISRIAKARARDPACYTVYKSGIPGQLVMCLCGAQHINDKVVGRPFQGHGLI
jgi:hypothetical protein